MSVFKEFLQEMTDQDNRIKVYLKPIPQTEGQSSKSSNIMLSGRIKAFDEDSLWLRDKECLVTFDSIKSIKPA